MLLFALAACPPTEKPDTADTADTADTGGAPCLAEVEVLPAAIEFGGVRVGDEAIETVTVRNVGCEGLEVYGVALEDPETAAWFTISAIGAVLVPPGSETSLTLAFAPPAPGAVTNALYIDTSDESDPRVEIPVTGEGLGAALAIDASACAFEDIPIGCGTSCVVTLGNTGSLDLVVEDFEVATGSDDLQFDPNEATNGALPWTLAPGTSANVAIHYTPADGFVDVLYLTVASNDPVDPDAQVSVTGSPAAVVETCE